MRRAARLSLFPAAALAVHQLRYLLAFHGHPALVLSRQGHAYVNSLAPWIALVLAAGVGAFLWALGRALAGHRSPSRYGFSLSALWLICTIALIGIYVCQELLEGALAGGHPAGIAGVFGYGGIWALPVAACVALVLAAILHGARWVLDDVASRRNAPRPRVLRAGVLPRPADLRLPRLAPLADGASGRGPPR